MSLNLENLFSVKDKVGIVTGGSRGIGEMIASGFLANKAKVYITARKEEALLDKAKELSEKFDTECIPFVSDLSNLDGIKKFKALYDNEYNEDGTIKTQNRMGRWTDDKTVKEYIR